MTLKMKNIREMDAKERKAKLQEFKVELIKVKTTASKTKSKTKDIKRAIARLLTFAQAENRLGRTK